ncbi:S11 family D-Ala-D-Ala carboxypeptidase [Secundilactobacillus odoratitofui DSM 19909 = JCM 15043]|uniref:S11 family D-Ala-D-Ala carboxypeptidase n=1 Tax=Secundilactobacillus odoratitofui DSM 19909 = JCM 15043 TaxID=1423776 RepID=A0A0R1M3F4_9LACO|nr:serine hydrolase [Secundilactobacillus odoratitofui]KRK99665.1 S11 family D-Ala-D-Ala carboxypeptidase [Secundilactobacillus odoratitofui DSM 19909 = JCM 15043]
MFSPATTGFAKSKKDGLMSNYTKVKAAYVMDAKSGQTLYENKADKTLPIASLSKMMTLYLTTEAINQHKLHWSDKVAVDKNLIKMSKNYGLGTFKIKRSKQYTVKQLYQAALIASSNSAAIALGNAVAGGSNAKFIAMMNKQAKDWGIAAHFISSSGLDNTDLKHYGYRLPNTSASAQNMVSAKAISVVAQHLVAAFPQISKWSSKATYDLDGQTLVNANALVKDGTYYRASNHLTGLKTGYTETAGLCLTVTYWRNGRELIATILGSDTTFTAMNGLITHLDKTLLNKTVKQSNKTYRVKNQKVTAAPTETTTKIWYRKGQDASKIKVSNQLTATKLPIQKGSQVTTTSFENTGLPATTNLGETATKTVKKQSAQQSNTGGTNWFGHFFKQVGHFFSHLF